MLDFYLTVRPIWGGKQQEKKNGKKQRMAYILSSLV
jgi:hypothetical protein